MNTDKQLFGDSRLVNSVRSKNLYTTINNITSISKRIEGLANTTAADNGKAIQKIKPTVNANDLKKQEEFTIEFGQEG